MTKTFNLRVTDAQRRREILSPNSKQSAETLEARMVPPPLPPSPPLPLPPTPTLLRSRDELSRRALFLGA